MSSGFDQGSTLTKSVQLEEKSTRSGIFFSATMDFVRPGFGSGTPVPTLSFSESKPVVFSAGRSTTTRTREFLSTLIESQKNAVRLPHGSMDS